MRRHLSLLLALPLAASFYVAGCLSDSDGDGVSGAGGASGSSNNKGSGGAGGSTSAGSGGSTSGGSGGSTSAGSGGSAGAAGAPGPDPSQNEANKDAAGQYVTYRDELATHPGCSKVGLETRIALGENPDSGRGAYTSAEITGFPCAAKAYDESKVDPAKPIVVLVHGNSSTPLDYEFFLGDGKSGPDKQLAEQLVDQGFRVFSADFRFDLVNESIDQTTGNPAKNMDHGWTVPILQGLVTALLAQYPTNKISLVGFSLGTTTIRDALRRMHRAKQEPFARIQDLVLISGANHGVSTFAALCGDVNNPINKTMRGAAACQLGDRAAYTPVPFLIPINGPDGTFEAPCADGSNAYGQTGVCGGNTVQYTTLVKEDPESGQLQDEFVSEASALLGGAQNNGTVPDKDLTGYFLGGLFDDHYGALRSASALTTITTALGD